MGGKRKFAGGEGFRVRHTDHNAWQDAGDHHGSTFGGSSGSQFDPDEQTGVILVKNTTGRDLPRYSVLTLYGSIYDPTFGSQVQDFKNQIALKGIEPTSAITGRFCVLQMDAPNNAVVPALVSGLTVCRVKVESLTDEFADIETTNTIDQTRYLKSGSSGSAQIIHRPEALGEQWGYVRLGNRPTAIEEIIVRNNSGEEIPRHAVMRVTGVTMEDGVEVHTVEKPNSTFKTRYIVNSGNAIAIGDDGVGYWLGDSGPVLYNNSAGTPAVDEEWGAKNGQWSLEKYRPGFLITGGNENNGTLYWTRAKQRIVTDLIGKNDDSSISADATGTFSIYMGQRGSEAATEYDITAGVFVAYSAANKWSSIGFRNGNWYAVPLVC